MPLLDRPVTLNLHAIEQAEGHQGEMLNRFLRLIQWQRGDYNGRMLTIRRDDLPFRSTAGASLLAEGRQPLHDRLPVGDPLGPIDIERCRVRLTEGLHSPSFARRETPARRYRRGRGRWGPAAATPARAR